ncbi:MAG: flagellar M-ring protein FliF [Oligoflexales bacterium]|nr:flagellar M-ring protein FliF [Oligoflexales bacterium]
MEKLTAYFEKVRVYLLEFFTSLSIAKKMMLGGLVLTVLISISSIVFIKSQPERQYLYTDLSPEDVSSISSVLKKNEIQDYIIDKTGIQVPKSDIDRLRLILSQEGLPNKGLVGWEKFDESDFSRTEFEQEIHKLRAIQGELSRTISSIEGIKTARVHIVMPKNSLFIREQKQPTAAIYLSTKQGFHIDKKQIRGIQHLVSRSVEGLEPKGITILDSEGNMLTEIESNDPSSRQTNDLLNFKTTIEHNLEQRIRSILGKVVGIEKVDAKVDAEVDFTQEKQTISNVDPDNTVVVSKNTTGFSMQGEGLSPTGIPGSKSNVPGEQEDVIAKANKSGSKKETEMVNYEFSKKISEKTLAVGNIVRLTISTIVDGKQDFPIDGAASKFVPRSPEEMKKIEALVKDAVGFKEGRDSLTVQNMMFELDNTQITAIKIQKEDDREYLSKMAFAGVIALALILFFAFIVRPYFRWLMYDPEKKQAQSIIEEYKPELEMGSMQSVKVQEEIPFEKLTPKEQVMFLARNEPKRTTEALRMLMNPTQVGGA